jgi:hypothetical protein
MGSTFNGRQLYTCTQLQLVCDKGTFVKKPIIRRAGLQRTANVRISPKVQAEFPKDTN